MNKSLTIQSASKTYDAIFVAQPADLLKELSGIAKAIVVLDRNLVALYPVLVKELEKIHPVLSLEATEETKTLTGMEKVLNFLLQHNATKSTSIIAIGGGIIQDIASFAAHIYFRGIPFVYVPTTLLAMSDSCIGAKCGLNYNGYKNQLGMFHPPEKVIIWPEFLVTLTDEAIYSGYGEIFKLALIDDRIKYEELKDILQHQGIRNKEVSRHILQSLVIKKGFIEEDEYDLGVRRILNYGHTFGHALELLTQYAMAHGIAVARGIDIANYVAFKLGFLKEHDYLDIHQFVEQYFHCDHTPKIAVEALIENTKRDKKVANGKLNMILLEAPGKARIEAISFDEQLWYILRDYFQANRSLYSLE